MRKVKRAADNKLSHRRTAATMRVEGVASPGLLKIPADRIEKPKITNNFLSGRELHIRPKAGRERSRIATPGKSCASACVQEAVFE
jgi:hypothetical protein